MFGSVTLDVLIGIILIFFLLSVACSAIVEAIAGWCGWRSKTLERGLVQMLAGKRSHQEILQQFLKHPLLLPSTDLSKHESEDVQSPSYLSSEVFADVLIDLLGKSTSGISYYYFRCSVLPIARTSETTQGGATGMLDLTGHLRDALTAIVQKVEQLVPGGDNADALRMQELRVQLGKWFDQTMDRAGGWYKRKVQNYLLGVSLVIVLVMNIDAISIMNHLIRSPNARQALATMAEQRTGMPGNEATPEWKDAVSQLRDVAAGDLPIGWPKTIAQWRGQPGGDLSLQVLLKALGLLVSIFAVSLGAPFWFDVLNKVSNIRSAGKKPTEVVAAEVPRGEGRVTEIGLTANVEGGVVSATVERAAPTGASAVLPGDYWSQPVRKNDLAVFDPMAPDFAMGNAAFLAKAALLAYRPQESVKLLCSTWGFEPTKVQFFDTRDTQAFVAANGRTVVVSFRGTEPSSLQDIISDAQIALTTKFGGRVHCGFLGALEPVLTAMTEYVRSVSNQGTIPIWVTGHSLGAALATLFGATLIQEKLVPRGLYTFGSPRVGDVAFAETLGGVTQCYRFVNGEDLVTRVAPRAMGYAHVGKFRYLDASGKLFVESDQWLRFLNTVINAMNDFKKAAVAGIKDHSMELYVRKLENLTLGQA